MTDEPKPESALAILVDLIDDPKDNGDYKLCISGADLDRLWRAVESLQILADRIQTKAPHD